MNTLQDVLEYFPAHRIRFTNLADLLGGGYIHRYHGTIRLDVIFLSRKNSEETRVQVMLHELAHFLPDFREYTEGLLNYARLLSGPDRNEELEAGIDAVAQQVYTRNKPFTDKVRRRLREAWEHCSVDTDHYELERRPYMFIGPIVPQKVPSDEQLVLL
jgi:hypothetical protein